jgi:predicted PurR-regulated permease PerM
LTLFGHTFDGVQIASLVSLLLVLVLWIMRFKGERDWARWFRQWEADRKARRDAEIAAENGDTPESGPRGPRGPWG